ncbi:hypothetical protein [Janthinobacterium agaricidamnosum]|nr:hypothetical protein [Janthinobacterium agaricidamnosum]
MPADWSDKHMKKSAGKTMRGRSQLISPEFLAMLQGIKIADVPPPAKAMGSEAPASAAGSQVKAKTKAARTVHAPQFDIGTLLSLAGDKIIIEFPENSSKTFMAEFLTQV